MGEKQEEMGLDERLLHEQAEEVERRRGSPLGASYGSDSPVLDGLLLADARRIGPRRGIVAICACSIGTPTRGRVPKAQRCASPA